MFYVQFLNEFRKSVLYFQNSDEKEPGEELPEKEEVKEETDSEKSKTDTDIIVKPDGSRVLVVTTNTGGMETVMSLELSKPTDMDNGIHQAEVPSQEQDGGKICCLEQQEEG